MIYTLTGAICVIVLAGVGFFDIFKNVNGGLNYLGRGIFVFASVSLVFAVVKDRQIGIQSAEE